MLRPELGVHISLTDIKAVISKDALTLGTCRDLTGVEKA